MVAPIPASHNLNESVESVKTKYWVDSDKPEIVCGWVLPNPTTAEYSTTSPLENPWLAKLIEKSEVEIPAGFTNSFLFVKDPPSRTLTSDKVFFASPVWNFWVPFKAVVPKEIVLIPNV